MKYSIYWRDTEAYTPGPALDGDVECDVAMIGGGYTSLWTSHFLKKDEPKLDIRILESDFVGAGASGHNDGFLTPTIGHSLRTVVHLVGPEKAKAAYSAVGRSLLELPRFCAKNGIDAEIESSGFFLVATSDAQRRRLESDIALVESLGGITPPALVEGTELRAKIPSPVLQAGISGGGALINPFKLVRGLARLVAGQGVAIHEQTRVSEIQNHGSHQILLTPRGRVRAKKVLFATNAYQTQYAQFKRQILPVWSYALVSKPLTDVQLARLPWPGREGFVEARNFIIFARLTRGNRILIGGGPAPYYFGGDMRDEAHINNRRLQVFLEEQGKRFFPMLDDLEWEYSYGGCIAMTRDLVPQAGQIGDNVFYAHGYCGNGIGTTHATGKALRDLILGKDSLYSNLFYVRKSHPKFPPEPFAYAGARGMSLLLAAQDKSPNVVRWPRI